MDLERVSPRPWVAWRREQQSASTDPTFGGLVSMKTGLTVKALVHFDKSVALDADFAGFAALCANALDVLERRGWSLLFDDENKLWSVHDRGDPLTPVAPLDVCVNAHPFVALVESDRWKTEQEESGGGEEQNDETDAVPAQGA